MDLVGIMFNESKKDKCSRIDLFYLNKILKLDKTDIRYKLNLKLTLSLIVKIENFSFKRRKSQGYTLLSLLVWIVVEVKSS